MLIIWISAYYHDSSACLIKDWKIISAVQEERFTRKKQDSWFPKKSIEFCLKDSWLSVDEIDYFVFYEKPFLKFERLLENYLTEAPFWFSSFFKAIPVWLKEKLFLKKLLIDEIYSFKNITNLDSSTGSEWQKDVRALISKKLRFAEHHQSHWASAFYPSPFEESAVLTIDWVGEWTSTSLAYWKWNSMEFLQEIHYPHSVWLLYSAMTYFLWFKVNSWEYKVMGLAPYWEPKYSKLIKENLLDLKEDWSFHLNLDFFNYTKSLRMTWWKMEKLFWIKRREWEAKLEQIHMDIASSLQDVIEEMILNLAKFAKKETWSKNLCLAWWVALNCVWNWKIIQSGIFENVWIQPASWDAGWAIWAGLAFYYEEMGNKRIVEKTDSMQWAYLWPQSSKEEIEKMIKKYWAKTIKLFWKEELTDKVSQYLSEWKVCWWHQGKMEFWPRSLWNRSILWDARSSEMQKTMNLKIKFRESFRPFAPSILREDLEKYFDLKCSSPYMLLVAPIAKNIRKKMTKADEKLFWIEKLNIKRSKIPAVTHVDYSARVQTVHKKTNPLYHSLISKFKEKTWSSVLVNTSFNVRWEPIVCNAEDSYKCFMRTNMDILAIENYLFIKEDQPNFEDKENWEEVFELD